MPRGSQLLTIIQACGLVECEQPGCLRLQEMLCDQLCVIVAGALHAITEWTPLPVDHAVFHRYSDHLILNIALASNEGCRLLVLQDVAHDLGVLHKPIVAHDESFPGG